MKGRLLFLLAIFVFASACSSSTDCMVSDVVESVSEVEIEEKKYSLYLRTSGFGEKENFYELYDHVPEFDVCGVSRSSPISEVHVDTTAGSIVRLDIKENILSLRYSKDLDNAKNLKEVEIKVE